MGIVVQKFGGTSVANPEAMRRVAKRAIECKEAGNQVVVVVSAMGDSTDDLLDLMHKVTSQQSKREVDMLLARVQEANLRDFYEIIPLEKAQSVLERINKEELTENEIETPGDRVCGPPAFMLGS